MSNLGRVSDRSPVTGLVTGVTGSPGDEKNALTSQGDGCDETPGHGTQKRGVTDDGLSLGYRLTRAHKGTYRRPVTPVTSRPLSTKIVEKVCICGAAIFAAFDEGRPVRVDAEPVDHRGEIVALLEGRWTFARLHCRELVHRHAGRIRHGLRGEAIHAEHRCPGTKPAYTQPSLIGAA
jgi:hypothetical protein